MDTIKKAKYLLGAISGICIGAWSMEGFANRLEDKTDNRG